MSEEIEVWNTTAAPMPMGGLIASQGSYTLSGCLNCTYPATGSQLGLLVVTDFSIPPNSPGKATWSNRVDVAIDRTQGIPGVGDTIGSTANSFLGAKGQKGFICYGGTQDTWSSCYRLSSTSPITRVRVATAAVLPAYTYFNGPDVIHNPGVGATLTGNANGALVLTNQGGIIFQVGDLILVKDEYTTFPNQQFNYINGIYTVTQIGDATHPYILTRTPGSDNPTGMFDQIAQVSEGLNAGSLWLQTTILPITMGVTFIVWVQITAAMDRVFLTDFEVPLYLNGGGSLGIGGTNPTVRGASQLVGSGLYVNYPPYATLSNPELTPYNHFISFGFPSGAPGSGGLNCSIGMNRLLAGSGAGTMTLTFNDGTTSNGGMVFEAIMPTTGSPPITPLPFSQGQWNLQFPFTTTTGVRAFQIWTTDGLGNVTVNFSAQAYPSGSATIVLKVGGTPVPTTGGSNSWTGTNTFHPSTDSVPITAQGGGAGTSDLFDALSAGGSTVFSISASGAVTGTSFSGSGSGLTGLNASNLTSGNVDPRRDSSPSRVNFFNNFF